MARIILYKDGNIIEAGYGPNFPMLYSIEKLPGNHIADFFSKSVTKRLIKSIRKAYDEGIAIDRYILCTPTAKGLREVHLFKNPIKKNRLMGITKPIWTNNETIKMHDQISDRRKHDRRIQDRRSVSRIKKYPKQLEFEGLKF